MDLVLKIPASCISAVVMLIACRAAAAAAPEKEAHVTQIIKDVQILPFRAVAHPAAINDKVDENTGVKTGDESRSELTFADLTITRLGANTVFSFNNAGREIQLDSGAILFRVPKNSGGGSIQTHAVTVGITGTTVIFEYSSLGRSTLTVLEGDANLALVEHPDQSKHVRAGQMLDVPAGAEKLPAPVEVDLSEIMRKSPLINGFPPLPSQDLIIAAINDQQAKGSSFPHDNSTSGPSGRSSSRPPTPVRGTNATTGGPIWHHTGQATNQPNGTNPFKGTGRKWKTSSKIKPTPTPTPKKR